MLVFLTLQREHASKFSVLCTVELVPAVIGKEKILHCTVGVPLEPLAALQKKQKLRGKCFLSLLLTMMQKRMITSLLVTSRAAVEFNN